MNVTIGRILSGVMLLFVTGVAGAVVNNVQIVNQTTGQPVAGQTVTIVFPDGREQQEDTDDKGVLIFDFPNDGKYVLRYPGGQMEWVVTGAATGTSNVTWLAVTGAVLAVGAAVAIGSDDDDDDNAQSDDSGGTAGTAAGTYSVTAAQTANPDSHPISSLNGTYTITVNGSSVIVAHSSGTTNFSISGSISGNTISASGSGVFEGQSGSTFLFQGSAPPLQATLRVTCPGCPDSNSNSTKDPVQVNLTGNKST